MSGRCRHVGLLLCLGWASLGAGKVLEIHPAVAQDDEEFERVANALQPGDELVLHGGVYSQTGRRALTLTGTADRPILIRAAVDATPTLTRPAEGRYNNIEFVDCCHLVIRGLRFQGGSSGVRFIRGHHITFEACEICETRNNALTMNSGNCDAFLIRNNHIHHTGLRENGPTEGEGMYIGCHDGSCITTNTLIEGNHVHHLRGTSVGGSDGIEIKYGSYNNTVRNNVIHDTNLARPYPGVFVYGGGQGVNIVEGNRIWNAGEGIQVVADAVIRNNVIFDCTIAGITAAPHAAVPQMRNVRIVNNTIVNHRVGVRLRWSEATEMVFGNNAVYCPGATALDAAGVERHQLSANHVSGRLVGVSLDASRLVEGGDLSEAFVAPAGHDYRPRPGSLLIGRADPSLAPPLDFTGAVRHPPFDVGAYALDL
ncbi:MAG: right-handed parallel beta-helix repeat-containing protein [Planctomycetes bacterium]|nr:right-handed parallel beta-helix repeat-containing protein [Planctomycetota bacterium]